VAVVGFTNLNGGDANKAYYEAEVAEAAQEQARTRLAAYYATPMAARWVSLSGRLAPDGAEIAPGEISRAFDGYAPRAFTAQDRQGQPVETGAVADRLDAPNRRAGTDMTVSQPKSYSALVAMAELAGEAALARDLREARHQVVREVVKHALGIGLVQTRRGHGGRAVETPSDVMVAVIPHSKSRAGDPQEHDHVLFFNGSLRADGTVGTLDLSRLVSHKFYLQALVASGMADRMQRLGFAVQEAGRGRWELAGAPDDLLKAWSQRRAEVVAGLHGTAAELARTQAAAEQAAPDGSAPRREGAAPTPARGTTQARREAMQASALKSRRAKAEMPDAAALTARHREDLDRLGLTPDGVIDHMRAVAPHTPVPEGQPAEAALAALFERTSVATMRQVRTAVAEAAAVRGMPVAEVEAEVRQAVDSGVAKAIGVAPTGEAVFSTDQAIRTERAMLVAARDGQGQGLLTPAAAERAMARIEAREQAGGRADFAFAPEQRQAVLHAARGDQFVVLEGVAGAGKTTSMQAVVSAAQAMGLRTIGVAPTNAAAETLRAETKADEHLSLQKLAGEIAKERRVLTRRDYVLVDEAGMAELADVAALVRAARAGGAQVAFVGDERQFAPIGSGAPFAALGSVLGSSRLTEIRRQRTPWQTEASRRMAAGDSEAGTLAYAAEGRWTFGQHRADTFARLKADWTADLGRSPAFGEARATRIVVAQRNEDVHALNAELRQVLVDRGTLGQEEITVRTLHRDGGAGDVRDLSLRAGDELIVWRRVPSHNLNNGDRLTVLGFQPMPDTATGDVLLTWRVEKSGTVVTALLSSLEAPPAPDDPAGQPRVPYLQHGYAVSMYASQSKTVDRGFVFGGTGLDARSTYVALTRHRDDAQVYWDRDAIAQELAEQGERPTRAAVVEHIRREARRVTEACSVLDFVPDADAWLATGDVAAERSRPSIVAARMAAASQTAAATVLQAAEKRPDQVAALAGGAQEPATARSHIQSPRTDPEVRAAAAYARETSRIQEAAAVRDRRAMARVDAVVQALKTTGNGLDAVDGAAGSEGEVTTTELAPVSRPAMVSTLAEVGIVLSETKTLLAKLQASMLCGQVAAYAAQHRVCAACGVLQPLKDRRTRRLQTLFGTVELEAPRFKLCRCRLTTPMAGTVLFSPVCALLSARCTPELERVQAELGARTSFRDGARILEALLPVSPANRESLRTRTHAIALRLEAADRQAAAGVTAVRDAPDKAAAADASRPVVMLDGAYIRAVPGHQVRNFEAICGKVELEGQPTRHFALVRSVAEQPHALLRAALQGQGWREGDAVTAISDGDPALPALVRSTTAGPVQPILDWFHLSMRVQHVEPVMRGLCALEPPPLDPAQIDVERSRHLL